MMSVLPSFRRRVDSDHRTLSSLRLEMRAWFENHADASLHPLTRFDAELAVTELVANAIDHSQARAVDVVVTVEPDAVAIEVANPGAVAGIPPPEEWGTSHHGDRGRGLGIVRAFCRDVEIGGNAERTVVRVRVPLRRS